MPQQSALHVLLVRNRAAALRRRSLSSAGNDAVGGGGGEAQFVRFGSLLFMCLAPLIGCFLHFLLRQNLGLVHILQSNYFHLDFFVVCPKEFWESMKEIKVNISCDNMKVKI